MNGTREFCDRLVAAGMLTAEGRETLVASDSSRDEDEAAWSQSLVEAGVLTEYQRELFLAGRESELTVGPYLIQAPLARGGMGEVFVARHRTMGRLVALKCLPREMASSDERRGRFLRELRLAGRLNHPNIVTSHDAGEDGGRIYLAMELLAGRTLAERAMGGAGLSLGETLEWTRQAAHGLAAAHAEGILHRDVKPSNVFVTEQGVVKLLDLGLACATGELALSEQEDGLTGVRQVLGTVEFMAPEQAAAVERADVRADVYGLGCCLFFALLGRPPFRAESWMEVATLHQTHTLPSICQQRSDVPAEVDRLVQRMTAKDPEHRMRSMEAVIESLDDIAAVVAGGATRIHGSDQLHETRLESDGVPPYVPPLGRYPSLASSAGDGERRQPADRAAGRSGMRQRFRPGLWAAALAVLVLLIVWGGSTLRAGSGRLQIEGAALGALQMLTVDGEKAEFDARQGTLLLPPGTHVVRICLTDGRTQEKTVVIVRGRVTSLTIDFDAEPAGGIAREATGAWRPLAGAPQTLQAAAWGDGFLSCVHAAGDISVWSFDKEGNHRTGTTRTPSAQQAVALRGGRQLVAWDEAFQLQRIDVATGEVLEGLDWEFARVAAWGVSPTRGRLYLGDADGRLHVIDLGGQGYSGSRREHAHPVTALAVSADGAWLATGDQSGQVLVWDLESEEPVLRLDPLPAAISALALSNEAQSVFVCDATGELRRCDRQGRMLARQTIGGGDTIAQLVVFRTAPIVVARAKHALWLWDSTQQRLARIARSENEILAAACDDRDVLSAVDRQAKLFQSTLAEAAAAAAGAGKAESGD